MMRVVGQDPTAMCMARFGVESWSCVPGELVCKEFVDSGAVGDVRISSRLRCCVPVRRAGTYTVFANVG